MVDSQGKTHKLNIGYIGFVPPQIMVWDKANLQGKVETRDIVKTAQKYVPEMKQKGADIIVALAHTGPSDEPYQEGAETHHSTLLMYHTLMQLFSVTPTVYSRTKSLQNHQMQILLKVP